MLQMLLITQQYVIFIRLDFFASLKGFFCIKMKYFGKLENLSTIFGIGLSKLLNSFKYDNVT